MSRYAAVLSVIFAFVLFSGPAQPLRPMSFTYTPVDLSAAAAGGTRVNGINARGDIVGRYRDSGGTAHGFLLLWTAPSHRST